MSGTSGTKTDIMLEMQKIKKFEESAELVDFFKTPIANGNDQELDFNRSTIEEEEEEEEEAEAENEVPQQGKETDITNATAPTNNVNGRTPPTSNTLVNTEVGKQNNMSDNSDVNSSAASSSLTPDPPPDPPPQHTGCRNNIQKIFVMNGDDGPRCGKYCTAARFYNIISFIINIISIVIEILKNTRDYTKEGRRPWYPAPYPTPRTLHVLSIIMGGLFAVELLLRFIVAEAWWSHTKSRYHLMTGHPDPSLEDRYNKQRLEDGIHGKELPFFKNVFNILDALSIFWWENSLFRILRVLRLTTRWESSVIVYDTLRKSAKPISVSMMYLLSFLTLIASFLFFLESCYYNNCELPDLVSTTYFLIITITTVGYGDIVPTSFSGRLVAIAVMLTGSFFLAMPLSIIGTEFERAFSRHEKYLAEQDKTGKLMRQLELRQQRVTVQQRRVRAMQLGYKLADVIEENYASKQRRLYNHNGTLAVAQSVWQLQADRDMIKMAQQLLRDVLILFNINLEEVRAIEEEIQGIRMSNDYSPLDLSGSGQSMARVVLGSDSGGGGGGDSGGESGRGGGDGGDGGNGGSGTSSTEKKKFQHSDSDVWGDGEEEDVTTWSEDVIQDTPKKTNTTDATSKTKQPTLTQQVSKTSSIKGHSDSIDLDFSLKQVKKHQKQDAQEEKKKEDQNHYPEQLTRDNSSSNATTATTATTANNKIKISQSSAPSKVPEQPPTTRPTSTGRSSTMSTNSRRSSTMASGRHRRRKSVVEVITDILQDHQNSFEMGTAAQNASQLKGGTREEQKTLFRNPTLAAAMLKKKLEKEKRKAHREKRKAEKRNHRDSTSSSNADSRRSSLLNSSVSRSSSLASGQSSSASIGSNRAGSTSDRISSLQEIDEDGEEHISDGLTPTASAAEITLARIHNVMLGGKVSEATLNKRTSDITPLKNYQHRHGSGEAIGTSTFNFSGYVRSVRRESRRNGSSRASSEVGSLNGLEDMWDASNGMYNRESPITISIKDAEQSDDCRSKLWLLMDVPWHNPKSKCVRTFRLCVTLISLILLYCETLPALNKYGPDTRLCRQIVSYHCGMVPDTPFDRMVQNPLCFGNKTSGYKGCRSIQTPSDFTSCGFPNEQLGFSCPLNATSTTPKAEIRFVRENWFIAEQDPSKILYEGQARRQENYTVRICDRLQCIENGMEDWSMYFQIGETVLVSIFVIELLSRIIASTRPAPLETLKERRIRRSLHFTWSHLFNVTCGCNYCYCCLSFYECCLGVLGCCRDRNMFDTGKNTRSNEDESLSVRFSGRMASIKNRTSTSSSAMNVNVNEKTYGIEPGHETLEKLVDQKHYDEPVIYGLWEWICQISNQLDTLAVGSAAFEVIWTPISFGEAGFRYEVWGFGLAFDPAVFRVIRVLVSARFISMERFFDDTTAIRQTISAVSIKLMAPLFFLFVFVLIMASLFIWVEDTISGDLYDCDDWNLILNSDRITTEVFSQHCTQCPSFDQTLNYSDPFLGIAARYDGSCRRLLVPTDSSSPHKRVEPYVQTFAEAVWFMFVTVTTTGYGRDGMAVTYLGRIVMCITSIMGTLYLAMPLSVVSSKFFEIFTKMQDTKKHKHEMQQKEKKTKHLKEASEHGSDGDTEGIEGVIHSTSPFHHTAGTKKLTFKMIVTLKMLARRIRRRRMVRAPLTVSQQHLILDYEDQVFVCHESLWGGSPVNNDAKKEGNENGLDNNATNSQNTGDGTIGGSIIQLATLQTLRELHMRIMYSILRQLGRGDNLHETMRVFHAHEHLEHN